MLYTERCPFVSISAREIRTLKYKAFEILFLPKGLKYRTLKEMVFTGIFLVVLRVVYVASRMGAA